MVTAPLTPRHLPAGAGRTFRVLGDLVTIKAVAHQTGGAYALFEVRTVPGQGPPPHARRYDDATFFILEGACALAIGDQAVELGPGGYAFVPRGTVHAYTNVGTGPARLLILASPGGIYEEFVADVGELIADPATAALPASPPDLGRALAAAPKYGIEFAAPPGG